MTPDTIRASKRSAHFTNAPHESDKDFGRVRGLVAQKLRGTYPVSRSTSRITNTNPKTPLGP